MSSGILFLKMCTSRSPRISAHITKANRAKVVTLIPPAVDALPPPISINPIDTNIDSSLSDAMSTELNPAVRGCTPIKNAECTRDAGDNAPSVLGLVHSNDANAMNPNTTSAAVVVIVNFACNDHNFQRRPWTEKARSTGNPSPPKMTAREIAILMNQSFTNCIKLSLYSAKPALFQAEILWNTPCETDVHKS